MEARRHFQFDESIPFVSALKAITKGEEKDAENLLIETFTQSEDPYIKNESAVLLSELLFNGRDFETLQTLNLLDHPAIDLTNRSIAKTLQKQPAPSFFFPNEAVHTRMKTSQSGCPTIEVTLNGRKATLWLDTGAGMSVLSQSLAKQYEVSSLAIETLSVENSSNQNVSSQLAIIDCLDIKGVRVTHQPTLVLQDQLLRFNIPKTSEVMKIDGIIGWDVIQHLHLEIDYKNRSVCIQKPDPKNLQANLFFCGAPIVKALSEQDTPLYFGLDTGAGKSHFSPPLLSKLPTIQLSKKTVHAGGVGDMKEREVQRLKQLDILLASTPIRLSDVREALTDFATFFKLDGVLGSDSASAGKLIIDYPNRRVDILY
ncbi:retropepsin-like aspartic protease [Halobacillus salinus]|uniref:retropepsin-like aspartic protease n=1 Tax=Halobacillus salinus TaxID=192814 RepID=UPI0009A8F008|nr:retropepsin-like aspartic protease [Halobacillus salinus]